VSGAALLCFRLLAAALCREFNLATEPEAPRALQIGRERGYGCGSRGRGKVRKR
jgi:hypothetical protein